MRHRKTKSRRRTSRRRRVSGVSSNLGSAAKKIAGIAGGAFLARIVATKLAPTMNPKIIAGVTVVAGVFLPRFIKGEIGEGVGDGLTAVGVLALLQSLGVVSGIGSAPRIPINTRLPNGYNSATARTVGASGKPFLNRAVGNTKTNRATAEMMGALLWGD